MHEILNVALGTPDRGIIEAQHLKAKPCCHCSDISYHILMDLAVSYDPFLSDLISSSLELRLDQAYHLSSGRKDLKSGRQYFVKAYE